VGEQHLDLLAIAPRLRKRFGLGKRARDIAAESGLFLLTLSLAGFDPGRTCEGATQSLALRSQ